MHNKIVEILEELGIDIGFMEYSGNSDEYIVFSIFNEKDTGYSDDTNTSETYNIQINYWFKNLDNISKYKKIKEKMKSNGFFFDSAEDLKDGKYFGKNMDFIYTLSI